MCVLSIKSRGEKIGRQSRGKKETSEMSSLKSRKLGREVERLKEEPKYIHIEG